MKNKNYIIAFAIVLTILASSCGSISITGKRYSRGLNIGLYRADEGKTNTGKTPVKRKRAAHTAAPSIIATESALDKLAESEDNSMNSQVNNVTEEPGTFTLKENSAKSTNISNKAAQKQAGAGLMKKGMVKRMMAKHNPDTIMNTDKESDSDVNLILLVILAIFIPPLAVYLYFGELNVHFWINLILCIIGGGFIGATIGYIGLAVIHALLVVFGVFG